jgi:phosphatidylglycerol:prolipoprotein diacylglycerol transferase
MDFWEIYQNLPLSTQPTAFQVGFFGISWYALMYLMAFVTVYSLLRLRIKKGESKTYGLNNFDILDFLLYAISGVLIGGRLGYALYDLESFWNDPLLIISPYDFKAGIWTGIYGMSYHGGFVGTLIASYLFSRRKGLNFWALGDFVVPTVPLGYFFGRIGNFLNGELYGRMTGSRWGMNFGDGFLRIPNQLLEAIFEGILVFIILWSIRNRSWAKGSLLPVYICLYAMIRFSLDFLREPDGIYGQLGGALAWSQIFSLAMLVFGAGLFYWKSNLAFIPNLPRGVSNENPTRR